MKINLLTLITLAFAPWNDVHAALKGEPGKVHTSPDYFADMTMELVNKH